MATEKGSGFERDFAYLVPFLDKVEQAGAGLTAPGAKEELARLMAGEKARWMRMRELLAGAAGQGAPPRAQLAPVHSQGQAALEDAARPYQAARGFTVGAMRKR
jgi:hypothetical protein